MLPEKLHFVIPFAGGVDLFRLTLESIFDQESPEWRVTIVENCSSDADRRALRGLFEEVAARFDSGVIEIKWSESQLSMAGNWNRCLDLAGSGPLCLLHSDDQITKDFVRIISEAMSRDQTSALFFCRAITIDERGGEVFSLRDRFKDAIHFLCCDRRLVVDGWRAVWFLLLGNFVFASGIVFSPNVAHRYRFDERLKFAPDYDLLFRMLLDGESFHAVPARLLRYRRHLGQTTLQLTSEGLRHREEADIVKSIGVRARREGRRLVYLMSLVRPVHRLDRQLGLLKRAFR